MIAPLLLAVSFESPLSIEVKNGCTNESLVIVEPITLYSDQRACFKVNPKIFFTDYNSSADTELYWAWGKCANNMIQFGYGKSREECLGSMAGNDGVHRTIMPSSGLDENTCVCHDRTVSDPDNWYGEDVYDSSVAYRCAKEEIEFQESQDEDPVPHTASDDYYVGWIVVFPILLLIIVLPLMLWPS